MLSIYCFLVAGCIVLYGFHISETKSCEKPYDFASFRTFLKEFSKYENHPSMTYGSFRSKLDFSCIDYSKSDGFHDYYLVDLYDFKIRFNDDKYMILYPFDWFVYCFWKLYIAYKHRKTNRVKGLWEQE